LEQVAPEPQVEELRPAAAKPVGAMAVQVEPHPAVVVQQVMQQQVAG
jgi:hypothetical protein